MTEKAKMTWGIVGGAIALLALVLVSIFLTLGPAGMRNSFSNYKAQAFGSDWLIIQYTGMGEVQNYWELHNAAIHNEGHSDGIYFTTEHGVVHLSGHYVYIQNPTPVARELYIKGK